MLSNYTKEYDLNAYSFEGIAGDDTSDMLPSDAADKFNSRVSYYLGEAKYSNGESSYTCAEAFLHGFDGFEDLGKGHPGYIVLGIIIIGAAAAIAIRLGSENIKEIRAPKNLREEHEVNTKGRAPILVTCDYCGGTYVFGETSCPHCGSPGKTSPGPGQG